MPGRRRREEAGLAAAEADDGVAVEAAEADEPAVATDDAAAEPEAEPESLTEEDELAARFDAARERLRATIKPPPPDDG